MAPEMISTIGYCRDRRVLQNRHRPRSAKKLTTGTRSYHGIAFPQEKQAERPASERPEWYRSVKTFVKLPIAVPSAKKKKDSNPIE
jgi:hypothetical protein